MKKTLTFYKNNSTNQWYLYIKWFPNFLRRGLRIRSINGGFISSCRFFCDGYMSYS